MNYEVPNDTPQLLDAYSYMRYSCLTRNRDNNGDGKIDRSEVRWYLAAINQLVGMYVGDGLLNTNTKLYNKSPEEVVSQDTKVWQQHVTSSTLFGSNSNDPTILWAEEGTSTSNFYHGWVPDIPGTTIRCVRNLGYIDGKSDESYEIDKEPSDYITVEKRADGSYVFTCTHLNEQALRYYTSKELILSDERSQENRLYKKFECYKEQSDCSAKNLFVSYNEAVDAGVAAGTGNPFCPKGYRTPSQIEAAIMRYYITGADDEKTTMTRTYYSFGPLGEEKYQKYTDEKYGFIVSGTNINVSNTATNKVRCVRDLRVD